MGHMIVFNSYASEPWVQMPNLLVLCLLHTDELQMHPTLAHLDMLFPFSWDIGSQFLFLYLILYRSAANFLFKTPE